MFLRDQPALTSSVVHGQSDLDSSGLFPRTREPG